MLPNGVRLSCGAELELSQTEDYLRNRGAGSFRRLLGGSSSRPCHGQRILCTAGFNCSGHDLDGTSCDIQCVIVACGDPMPLAGSRERNVTHFVKSVEL